MNLDNGSVLTLCIFMVVHLCGTVWWMSKVNATLGFIGEQIKDIIKLNAEQAIVYARRDIVNEKFAMHESQLLALWKRLDQKHACPNAEEHRERKTH